MRAGFGVWFNRVVPLDRRRALGPRRVPVPPRSVAYLPEPDALRDALVAAGFSGVNRHLLSGGLSQLLTATRTGRRR